MWLSSSPVLTQAGQTIDLSPYANRTIDALESEDIMKGWLGRGGDYDVSALLEEKRIAGFKFLLG